jgi:hypothetical protein
MSIRLGPAILAALLGGLSVPAAADPDDGAVSAPAAARGVDDPCRFVAETYAAYRRTPDSPPEDPDYAYSDRLRALFNDYGAWAAQHDDLVGSLDFDWWMNAQDWEPVTPQIREQAFGPDRRVVLALFANFGVPTHNHFIFVRENGRWYLDDVVNGDGHALGWTLSDLLRERPNEGGAGGADPSRDWIYRSGYQMCTRSSGGR